MAYYYKIVLTIIALLYATVYAGAELKTDSIRQLKTVMVKGKNSETRATAPLQILSSKEISMLNVLQLSDAVKHFSGVTVKDYGGIGGLKTVSVRSLGANHTAVSYDGITLSDVQTGQIDIGRFSLENVEMVSLYSGQADNIFQPARLFASASVLNISSKEPTFTNHNKANGVISLKLGSFGLVQPAFTINYKLNNRNKISLSGEYLTANGKYPYTLHYGQNNNDSTSQERRTNTDVSNYRVETSIYSQLTQNSKLTTKLYFYSSSRGLPGATIYYNLINFSSQRISDNTLFLQTHYLNKLSSKWQIQANAKYNRGYLKYVDNAYLNSDGRMENNYTQHELYASASALYRLNSNISASLNTDYIYNTLFADLHQFALPTRHSSLTALAAKYVDEKWLATASLLYTQTFEKVKNGLPAHNNSKLSPYLSISFRPYDDADLRFRAFYKNIFRIPTFNDLYYTRIGNRNLKPENTDQLNLGITYNLANVDWLSLFTFTMDAYHNRVTNKIVAYPTKNIFEWTMLNYGKVSIYGMDINAKADIDISEKVKLHVGLSHSYQRALNTTDPMKKGYNNQIPYTPRLSGSGSISLETPWIEVGYSYLWSGHRYVLNQNYKENRVEPYSDHSISLHRNFDCSLGSFRINVEILNIFNKNYEVVKYFPMPGRSIRGGVQWKF